ncbi:hypothetical protein CDSM653_01989 [Caldanaerobacter subterraneus subsp. pacificus DSM 12653]|uniref:Uncharacterized protein n=1 Tax=Caldanaerobacter subterraneus subsp. pacificus DSM 12653 TaxID=391606 RepID=A0A0F5PKL6_9THEO|nr:hypothetical protein CDSM653_01989 [Caldanaerobacter subterraneus subsp. pacificus DSM 12653]
MDKQSSEHRFKRKISMTSKVGIIVGIKRRWNKFR